MRFAFSKSKNVLGSMMPRLIFTLEYEDHAIEVDAIVDSGSSVNVLPYQAGLALNAIWDEQDELPLLNGTLGGVEARALNVLASHPLLTADEQVPLVFAWAKRDDVAVLLGEYDFFQYFDVCFYGSEGYFDVTLSRV